MPINVYWDNEDTKTIIRQDYVGTWTKTEYTAALEKIHAMLTSVTHTVDLVTDVREMKTNPMQALNLFSAMRETDKYFTDNHRGTLVIGLSTALQMPIKVAKQVASRATANLHTPDTLEDAYIIIDQLNQKEQ